MERHQKIKNCLLLFIFNLRCCKLFALKENRYSKQTKTKTKSLTTKLCPVGLSPRIICQEVSPFFPKMSQNCCPHQLWTVSPEPLQVNMGMGKNPIQQPKLYPFSSSEKSPLIDLNFLLSKFYFFPIKQQFSSNHPMQQSFVAAVISVVSYFKFQVLCTHMAC